MNFNAPAYHSSSAQSVNLKLEPDILIPAPCAEPIPKSAYLQWHTFTGVWVYIMHAYLKLSPWVRFLPCY